MAGSYPDVPGPRIAYDRDGTAGVTLNSTASAVVATLTGANLIAMNDDSPSTNVALGSTGTQACLIFPVLHDIVGIHAALGSPDPATPYAQWSANTTNGVDGTWTTVSGVTDKSALTVTGMRTTIDAVSLTGVKGLRVPRCSFGNRSVNVVHVYGQPSAAGDRLTFWHPTLDQALALTPAHLDWGDVPRSSTQDRTVRIKNLSATLTASTITVGVEALTEPGSPTHVSEYTLSTGGAFTATVALTSLAPGTVSGPITVRFAPGATSVLSLGTQRLYANAASWA